EAVKKAVSSAIPLSSLHPTFDLHLECDASEIGIGGCLLQSQPNGSKLPLAFISTTFTGSSKHWKTIEKEAFAIYYSITKLESFLLGRSFHLYTDHRNLLYLLHNPSSKIIRWSLYLQQFYIYPHFIKGSDNALAD